jgi:hypothetical protein
MEDALHPEPALPRGVPAATQAAPSRRTDSPGLMTARNGRVYVLTTLQRVLFAVRGDQRSLSAHY